METKEEWTMEELTTEELEAATGGHQNQDEILMKVDEINKAIELMERKGLSARGQIQQKPDFTQSEMDFINSVLEKYRTDFQSALSRVDQSAQLLKEAVDSLLQEKARIARNI